MLIELNQAIFDVQRINVDDNFNNILLYNNYKLNCDVIDY